MSRRTRGMIALALAGVLAAPLLTATGCDRRPSTVIDRDGGSSEETSSGGLTPLRRGEIRRGALVDVRAGIAAWKASDAKDMKPYWADDQIARFEKNWSAYSDDGLSAKHVHDVSYLDVIEMSSGGSQLLVSYRYSDESYLVDASGAKARSLEPLDVDMQLTLEKTDGKWKVIRTFAADEAYR